MSSIHPTAVVSPAAEIGQNVSVGPYCILEPHVGIGDDCQLAGHVVVKSGTVLGPANRIGEYSVLGGMAQHVKAPEESGRLVVGEGNVIREQVTIHCALERSEATMIGGHNMIMVGAHIGHDCQIGNHTIIVNNVLLAGHVEVQDRAYLSGAVAIHQFCRIGCFAMVGGMARIRHDVPPYVTVDGESSLAVGLNLVGLRRHGFNREQVSQLKQAYRTIYRRGLPWEEICERLSSEFVHGPASKFQEFLISSRRGLIKQRSAGAPTHLKLHTVEQDDVNGDALEEQQPRKAG